MDGGDGDGDGGNGGVGEGSNGGVCGDGNGDGGDDETGNWLGIGGVGNMDLRGMDRGICFVARMGGGLEGECGGRTEVAQI